MQGGRNLDNTGTPILGIEAFNDVKRAIVVVAHGDDMETMMGATAWMLAQRGIEFYEVICTQGDIGSNDESWTRETLAAVRREEAQAGARLLGFREVATLGYHDGELMATLALRARLASYYRKWQPDTLFTFDPWWHGQAHPDHTASGRAAVDALMPSRQRLYHPEQLKEGGLASIQRVFFFSPSNPSIFVDVTDVYDKKLASAVAHLSQFPRGEENLNWMRDLDTAAAGRAGLEGKLVEQFGTMRVW